MSDQTLSFPLILNSVGRWAQENFNRNVSKQTGAVLNEIAPIIGMAEEVGELGGALLTKDWSNVFDSCGDIGIYACDYAHRSMIFVSGIDQVDHAVSGSGLVRHIDDALQNPSKELLQKICCDLRATTRWANDFKKDPLPLNLSNRDSSKEEIFMAISHHVGGLSHATLKRHQGIRGYTEEEKHAIKCVYHYVGLLHELDLFIRILDNTSGGFIDVLNKVYHKVVLKRNWIKNPNDGVTA